MGKNNILFLVLMAFYSCNPKNVVKPTLPEIDFSSSNYFTPTDMSNFKGSVECNETPYWDNRKTKLQGFVFSGNINTKAKKFALYDNIKVFEPTNRALEVYYQSKDSAVISKALLDNSDKHCLIQVTCLTQSVVIIQCQTIIIFTITKPEDLEFK